MHRVPGSLEWGRCSPLTRPSTPLPGLLLAGVLLAGCETTRRLEQQAWIEVETRHFEIVSNADEATGMDLARGLELMRAVFERVTNATFEERVPTRIYVFEGIRSGREFGLGDGRGGYFLSTLFGNSIAVYTGFNPFEVIGHEYLHFLMHNHDRGFQYPSWYDEGFAEVLSHSEIRGGRIEVGVPPTFRLVRLQGAERLLPLETLMTARHVRELDADDRWLFYPQSWLLTHYFYFGRRAGFPDRTRGVLRYLHLVNAGSEPADAVRPAFGAGFEELHGELVGYLSRSEFPSLSIPLSALRPGEVVGARVLAPDDALTRLGELRLLLFGSEPSQSLIRRTGSLFHRAVAANPDNARAHAGLALCQLDPGDAERSLDRALRLAPEDPLILARYADWLASRLAHRPRHGRRRSGDLERARTLYRRSIERAPDLPLAHAGLGATYRFGGGPVEKGIRALERARELLPGSLDVALYLGELYLRRGDVALARRHLERVRRWSHGGVQLERAEELLRGLPAADAGLSERRARERPRRGAGPPAGRSGRSGPSP